MSSLLNRLLGRKDAVTVDARRIYSKLMAQSRNPEFFGKGKVTDNYDGRIDLLTLHIATVLNALNAHGEQGRRLSQGLYDVMRDDFEIAMREEGISDTGIKRRIKPMMQLFFTRVKTYVEALQNQTDLKAVFSQGLLENGADVFKGELESHISHFSNELSKKSLGEIAMAKFSFRK